MFKVFNIALAGVLAAGTATAGVVTYVSPEVVAIEEPVMMGAGSGMWLIPLLAIALILLVSNNKQPA
ncbi:MAG: hypothetical protein COA53_10140 [Rhodobacteraceae bacterium]|nr:MAG: hypothetical protein COA53_10140 [Paracoccaceae bacterium]